jgi:hypothetical protein
MPEYHGWTHRPKALGGTDPVDFAVQPWVLYRWYKEEDQVIADDTLTTIAWTDVHAADAWFSTDGFVRAGNAIGSHDTGLTTTEGIFQYAPGLWWVGYVIEWETGNYTKRSYLEIDSQADGVAGLEPIFGLDWAGGPTPTAVRNIYANQVLAQDPLDTGAETYHHHADVWDISVADSRKWLVRVRQTSGSDKTIFKAKLSAIWMGEPLGF